MSSDESNRLFTGLKKDLRHIGTACIPLVIGLLTLKYQYRTSELDLPIFLIAVAVVGLLMASPIIQILQYNALKKKNK